MSTMQTARPKRERKKRWGGRGKRRTNQALAGVKGELDFKSTELMRQFISPDRGKILPRKRTAATAKQQRKVARAVRRARQMGYIPYHLD